MGMTKDSLTKRVFPPGVHYEETVPVRRPIFQTGVPIFLGFGKPTGIGNYLKTSSTRTDIFRLTCREQFEQCIKPDSVNGFLDYAVRGFFENGGKFCIVAALRECGDVSERIQSLKKALDKNEALEDIDDADLVCVPDIMKKEISMSPDAVADLQQAVLAYCERMGDRFAILDSAPAQILENLSIRHSAPGVNQPLIDQAVQWQGKLPKRWRPVEGAMYFPWLHVKPFSRHKENVSVKVPPCGHIAGVYARSDALFGVHKAPANELLEGVLDLETHVSDKDQSDLNDAGVNCLRNIPGRGIRVWGARTLSGRMNWKYVNVRRLFLTFARWSQGNMDDLVFESNGPQLWNRVRRRIETYCRNLYQQGALKGNSPSEAFSVKCDQETNPSDVRESGRLICEVRLAPVIPAEFIVVHIVRNADGATLTIPTQT